MTFLENINHGIADKMQVVEDKKEPATKLIASKKNSPQTHNTVNTLTPSVTKNKIYNEALNPFNE